MVKGFLSNIFVDVRVPPEWETTVRREQLRSYVEQIPGKLFGLLILGCSLPLFQWNNSSTLVFLAIYLCIGLVAAANFRLFTSVKADPDKLQAKYVHHALNRLCVEVSVFGFFWSLLISIASIQQQGVAQLISSNIATAVMSCFVIYLFAVPRIAFCFVISSVVALLCVGLFGNQPDFLMKGLFMAGLGAVLLRMAGWQYNYFVRRVIGEQGQEEYQKVISLLLREFDPKTSDWLWETDRNGRVVQVSQRFAEAVKRPREVVEGMCFLEFFEDDFGRQLQEFFDNRRYFKDFTASVRIAGEQRWWTLSARPIIIETKDGEQVVNGFKGVCSDVTQERAAEAKIAYMAHFDVLTGVANRAHFASELEVSAKLQASTGKMFALHCVDLDDFKTINDTLGHPAGDALLKTVAQRIRQCVGDGDLIGRQGGDEFVVLQRDLTCREDAELMAEFLCDSMLEPAHLEGRRTLVSGSIGSVVAPDDGSDVPTLLKNADLALYSAKKAGRGCSKFFDPSMDEEARRRSMIEAQLRHALFANELELHFQPLIEVATMKVKGFESLLRWQLADGTYISPTEFIDIAETSGLIIPLGEWVIRTAIQEASTWPEHLTVAINLSPIQMTNPSLISTVVSALANSGLDPARIEFEITESVILEETELNMRTLHALRDLGAKIAMDDFGTGFSSLNYLRAFPFDKIKLDKCFVSEMETRRDCRAIIRAIMSLARTLKIRTTAEGIETQRQVQMLRDEGCTEFQGFLFSKAIPASQVALRTEEINGGLRLVEEEAPFEQAS